MAQPKRGRLNTITKVNRYIANIIDRMEREEISLNKGKTLVQCCNILIDGIYKGEVERELEEIQEYVDQKGL